ncbi:MAG TPA: response regulator, partial [Acidimicrobiales bacterium]
MSDQAPGRVLVVDDEPQMLRTLELNLVARGYQVELARTGELALELAGRTHPDLVILDLGLPGIDGVEVVRSLRQWSKVPILVLSARETEQSKVIALDAGADDLKQSGDTFEITCDPTAFGQVREALEKNGVAATMAEISQVPKTPREVDAETGVKVLRL